eukprot:TRINITY_DN20950_c0_g1_i2.p1 TRINITY_DN20950_c0_g1~~TRINITY_DN20950_c0_g1_i2.p1  ORF type:complete len:462 (-),score=85.03 TRINITY_DN20950_c0_g1_i2:66-1451(-)
MLRSLVGSEMCIRDRCLYLNLWRPRGASEGDKLDVMYWIYGGGFSNGAATPPLTNGALLAEEQQKIVVTINYRLSVLGFLDASATPNAGGGLNGIRDQILGLEWVRANVEAFGGDRDAVTVAGESAGGISSCILAVSPAATGLLARAIVQSGPCMGGIWNQMFATGAGRGKLEDWCAESANVSARECLSTLQHADPAALVQAVGLQLSQQDGVVIPNGSTIEGLLASGPLNVDAVLIGSNSVDTPDFFAPELVKALGAVPAYDNNAYLEWQSRMLPMVPEPAIASGQISREYPLESYSGNVAAAMYRILADVQIRCASQNVAHLLQRQIPVYAYSFEHWWDGDIAHNQSINTTVREGFDGRWSSHAAEVSLVFGSETSYWWSGDLAAQRVRFTAETEALSARMREMWSRFAASGRPEGGGVPWHPVEQGLNQSLLLVSPQPRMQPRFGGVACEFWDALGVD